MKAIHRLLLRTTHCSRPYSSSTRTATTMEPSPSEMNDQYRRKRPKTLNHTVAARLQALTLAEHGVHKAIAAAKSGMSRVSVFRLVKIARLRGYNPEVSTIMKEEYVTDKPRSGRRHKVTPEMESAILASGKLCYSLLIFFGEVCFHGLE